MVRTPGQGERLARRLARLALDVVGEIAAPTTCAACDERVRPRVVFCEACAVSVIARPEGASPRAAFVYGGAVATAILALKYRRRPDLAPRLGAAMAAHAVDLASRIDLVVPVPLHPRRLAERGFNQAALLASPIAAELGVPRRARALERIRDTPKQAELDRESRAANVEGAFRCASPKAVEGRRVLLVDDVRTTGATLSACAATLLASGARSVVTYAFAAKDRASEASEDA